MIRPRAVMVMCCLALATISFATAGMAMCMPAMGEQLQMDYVQQGLVFSAVMWSVPLAVLAGVAADRVGFRGLMILSSAVQALGWFCLAGAQSFWQAIAASILVGVGGSIAEPLVTPLVYAVYPRRRTAKSNLVHAFFCVGLAGVAAMIVLLQPAGVSWRWTFRLLGLLCIPHGLAAAVLQLPRQTHHGPVRLRTRTLLARPVFWLLAAVIFLGAAAEIGPANWLPSLLSSLSGPGTAVAGIGLILFAALMGAGRFMTAWLAGRLGVHRLLALAGGICAICLAGVALPLGAVWHVAFLGIVGFAVACFWPTVMAMAGDRFPRAGASMFASLSVCGGAGCAAAPIAVGVVAREFNSLSVGIAALAAAPVLIVVAALRLSRSAGADQTPPGP